jgi:carbonic anhydrase
MPERLIEGLRRFRSEYFPQYKEHYEKLVAEGQKPTTLFIGCSDSRVEPSLLIDAMPGELFVVRNVGNIVPPYETDSGYHGVSAAIEFAVVVLRVTDIVVCGHSHCGAIQALYEPPNRLTPHVERWLELARPAKLDGELNEQLIRRTEQGSVALQLERLMTFPVIQERVDSGNLSLHGWHYVIEQGAVYFLDVKEGRFKPIIPE